MAFIDPKLFAGAIGDWNIRKLLISIFKILNADEDAVTGITAHSGGTQAAAFSLDPTKGFHRIDTVAAANDSVRLPPAIKGRCVVLVNNAAVNSMQVFGDSTDTINDIATATGVAQAAQKTAEYYCAVGADPTNSVVGRWYRNLSA